MSDLSGSDEESDIRHLDAVFSDLQYNIEPSAASTSKVKLIECGSTSNYGDLAKVEAALKLNKNCDEKYRQLEELLLVRLAECNRRLAAFDASKSGKVDKPGKFTYAFFGKPYFRENHGYTAPDNEDTLMMNKLGMYNFSNVGGVPNWTFKDKVKLNKIMHKMSIEIKKKELNSLVVALQRENRVMKRNKNKDKISELKIEIANVHKCSLDKLALPVDEEYDWEYVANKLGNRHNANEYRSLWKQFLHPSINKSMWHKQEHNSLQKIAFERELQDWDAIANDLNTGRTSYQCFVYFRTNVANTFTRRKWTREEEEYLLRIIEYYREENYIPWGKVAAAMENRTKIQVYNKYARLAELRKGKFLPEEDSVILTCINMYGQNFRKVTEYLQGRSVTQCRERFHILAKRHYSTVWTVDEDRKLVQMMVNQNGTSNFSNVQEYFPGKNRVHIRSRYLTLSKWMQRNPNIDIRHAPRRGARRLTHGRSAHDLNQAIEKLKNRLQSEIIKKRKSKLTKDSPEEDLDAAIVAMMATNFPSQSKETFEEPQNEHHSYVSLGEKKVCNITILHKILILLRAKLNRQKFANSPLRNTYQGLLDLDSGPNSLKVKSYSKNQGIKNLTISNNINIWGNCLPEGMNYVLPPHYSTITGCKRFMSHYMNSLSNNDETNSLFTRIRKNALAKEQANILLDRFFALFLWPMQLSKPSPKEFMAEGANLPSTYASGKKFVAYGKEDYNFALPRSTKLISKIKKADENNIDLKDSEDCSNINIDEDSYFDSLRDIKPL